MSVSPSTLKYSLLAGLICLWMLCPFISNATNPSSSVRIYVNREFGFSVSVPFHAPTCGAEPDTQDTGIVIYLDHGMADCADREARPYIAVIGSYNSEEYKSPFQMLASHCKPAKPEKTDANIFKQLAQSWPASCLAHSEKGFVDLEIARQDSVSHGSDEPAINYHVLLHSHAADLDANTKALISTLKSVRFFPGTTKD